MEALLIKLLEEFKTVEAESYYHRNDKSPIVYPYLTFDASGEQLARNIEGFYIDIDIYDRGTSYSAIIGVEDDLKAYLKDKRIMTPDWYIRFKYSGSLTINTKDKLLKRRNLRFYCKVDWRKL